MERIVFGISAINFNNSNEFVTEKSEIPNAGVWQNPTFPCTMAESEVVESPNETEPRDHSDSESTAPFRRSLPARLAKSKENSLLHIKRRSIMKPRRNLAACLGEAMRPSQIKKLYTQNKIKGNFRPSNLETIFEESAEDKTEQLCFIGAKKIKRSLSCSDGLNVTKTTVKTRRLKVKKTFGRRFALKKISLEDFIDRLNASFEDSIGKSEREIPTEIDDIKTDEGLREDCDEEAAMECADETLLLT